MKIGDKVRVSGNNWYSHKYHDCPIGTVVTIIDYDKDSLVCDGDGDYYADVIVTDGINDYSININDLQS